MKYIVAILLLVSSSAFPQSTEQSQERDSKAGLYSASIKDAVRDIVITNKEGAALAGRQAEQISNGMMITKSWAIVVDEKARHEIDRQNQIAYAGQINPQIQHETAICQGQVPQATYDWCQDEIARLTPLAAAVNEWNGKVTARAAKINANLADLNEVTNAYNAKGIALFEQGEVYTAKYNLILARITTFKQRLKDLQDSFDVCKSLADPTATGEFIHETCGSVFDGNVVQMVETFYPVPDTTFKRYDAPPFCAAKDVCMEAVK